LKLSLKRRRAETRRLQHGEQRHQLPAQRGVQQIRVLAQILTHPINAGETRIALRIIVEHGRQRVGFVARQFGADRPIQTVDGGEVHRIVAFEFTQMAQRLRIGIGEHGHVGSDAVERALMALRVVFPALQQVVDRALVHVHANRSVHAAARRDETLQIAHPLQLADQRRGVRIVRAQRAHLLEQRVGLIELSLL
jgi:hypothetical protein